MDGLCRKRPCGSQAPLVKLLPRHLKRSAIIVSRPPKRHSKPFTWRLKHDLSFLLEQMKNHVPVSDDLLDIADSLNAFGVIVRYPNDIQIDESTVVHALQFADEIMAWAKNILEKHSNEITV